MPGSPNQADDQMSHIIIQPKRIDFGGQIAAPGSLLEEILEDIRQEGQYESLGKPALACSTKRWER